MLGPNTPNGSSMRARPCPTVLSNANFRDRFVSAHGEQYRKVRDYYLPRKGLVLIQNVSPSVPELVAAALETAGTEEE